MLIKEARKYSRCEVNLHGEVRMESGIYLEGKICDASLNGVWFSMEHSLPMGHPVRMNLVVNSVEEEQHISVQGKVSRIDIGGVAIAFTDMDAATMEKLKVLLQFITGEAGSI